MNSHILKIIGDSELPQPLEIDKSYNFLIKADVVDIRKKSNDDGSYDFIYSARQTEGTYTDELGKTVKIQDRKHQSVKLRQQLEFIAKEVSIEPQDFYESTMIDLRHYLVDIIPFMAELKKRE